MACVSGTLAADVSGLCVSFVQPYLKRSYECASSLVSLSSSPVAIHQAAQAHRPGFALRVWSAFGVEVLVNGSASCSKTALDLHFFAAGCCDLWDERSW